MNAKKVVVHMMNRNRVAVILDFLAESVCKPSETPHRDAHCEILAFDIPGAHVLGVRV
jgi:hypothetical protein